MNNIRKLLIVDDEIVGRQLLEAIFFSDDYQIDFAENGRIALQFMENNIPDLILMDVMMPEMDGFEVCRNIRSNEALNTIPIILITALDDRDSRKRGLEAGANDYISKPFDRIEIETKVKNLLQLGISQVSNSISDNDKSELEDYDEISYLTNLISVSCRPLKKVILQHVSDIFHIEHPVECFGRSILWFTGYKKILYFLYIDCQTDLIQYNLINILITTFINRTIQSEQYTGASDLLNQLNRFLSEKLSLPEITTVKNLELSLSLIAIDKESQILQFSGFNQQLLYFENNTVNNVVLDHSQQFPDIDKQFSAITFTFSPQAEIYLFNDMLSGLFKKHLYFDNNCARLNQILAGQESNTLKEQEKAFRKLIGNNLQTTEKTYNCELIGIKI